MIRQTTVAAMLSATSSSFSGYSSRIFTPPITFRLEITRVNAFLRAPMAPTGFRKRVKPNPPGVISQSPADNNVAPTHGSTQGNAIVSKEAFIVRSHLMKFVVAPEFVCQVLAASLQGTAGDGSGSREHLGCWQRGHGVIFISSRNPEVPAFAFYSTNQERGIVQ
jgi:hypothetical protein